jgi:hypothetical protein
MKVFICKRNIDRTKAEKLIQELLTESENSIAVLTETQHSENWKERVGKGMTESDFIVFLIGENTFESEQIIWEYNQAKNLNKQIIGIKLPNATEESISLCQGLHVFDGAKQAVPYLEKVFASSRQLKIEQYKIMVNSTEKVTDQRMKVNNLFFTITSSILSVALILGKTYSFIPLSVFAMTILTLLALITSYFWEKLVSSYGKLNTGKFVLINRLEKELRTNMFDDEWQILISEIKYEPNTKTETKIIQRFRAFIFICLAVETIYLLCKLYELSPIKFCICNN